MPFAAAIAYVGLQQVHAGMTISKSAHFAGGEYLLTSGQEEKAVGGESIPDFRREIVIKGNNLTVDFGGAVLRGTPATTLPWDRKGLGIRVLGKNVTIRNVTVRGYMVGLMAKDVAGLKLENCNFSNNWKQHLRSTPEKEDLSDWMSYHHNERDEWLRYGAGIYLRNCDGFEVKGCTVRGGQNALMLTGCDQGTVWNNDFSFNSGIGLGMYRSSGNRIMHNKMDWNVRGFSYGIYNRGQDSAGILIYEQSSHNVFAFNSVTHGGDGFFLWAGQNTMDSGRGGCNDNIVYGNDFSHAPTNGIESTFSRNAFVNNRVEECAHGVWGGYSYDTVISGNYFANNQAGVAIEHGQRNQIRDNSFLKDDVAITLWSNPSQDPNWGYGKYHETASVDNVVTGNFFLGNGVAFDQRRTTGTLLKNNAAMSVDRLLRVPAGETTPDPAGIRSVLQAELPAWDPWQAASAADAKYFIIPKKGGIDPFLPKGTLRGWKYIIVDEYGPYDFQRPLLWPERVEQGGDAPKPGANSAESSGRKRPSTVKADGPPRYEILGPKGRWRLVSAEGAKLSATSGQVPGFVTVEVEPGRVGTTKIVLEYTGEATTDPLGNVTPAGRPVQFGMSRFNAPIRWNVKIYNWTQSSDPSEPHSVPEPEALKAILAGRPTQETNANALDYASSGSFLPNGPANRFATVAEGEFEIPKGTYKLDVLSDDGIRIWLDGKLILNEWHYQGPTPYELPVTLGGKHKLRVEHFEIDGYSALRVAIAKKE